MFYGGEALAIDPKWLIDPKLLFVGPRIGEGAHARGSKAHLFDPSSAIF